MTTTPAADVPDMGALEMEMEALNPKQPPTTTTSSSSSSTTGKQQPFVFPDTIINKIKAIDWNAILKQIKEIDVTKINMRTIQIHAILKWKQFVTIMKFYNLKYPIAFKIVAGVLGFFLLKMIFFPHRGKVKYIPPHLRDHFGDIDGYYQLRTAKIDHWCLMGGDDCPCQDPTEPYPRDNSDAWLAQHSHNKEKAVNKATKSLDVVFYGDEIVDAWSGSHTSQFVSASLVQSYFNDNFHKTQTGGFDAIVLGSSGDTIGNLLWRIENGELPQPLSPKIFWINIGTNDLANGLCSEEAVTLGILKIADKINSMRPDSVIVIQSLLPRSSFPTGKIYDPNSTMSTHQTMFHQRQYYRRDRYPLWPSIKAINTELEAFCSNQPHLVYYDADQLFMGSMGNGYYQSNEKQILKELMPDFAHLSNEGYRIMTEAIAGEVENIITEGDEDNYKEKKRPSK
eukprot:CAMPEP_0119557706 /NCGR_PEP_ID=MMETSP1352-20130426/9283_1 /TAXON_ID=265584 /ORGANISM="Stauroneis constricta, Strain CCMP1120" /LENGTH=453 /DNA_ID=CAMNT_0007604847 /DNA_START=45 /DNA_END=1406 /DNA_ORIENTATION=+